MTALEKWQALCRNPLCRVHYQDRCCIKIFDRATDVQLASAIVCTYADGTFKEVNIQGELTGRNAITDAEWEMYVLGPVQDEHDRKWNAAAELAQLRISEAP